MPSVPPPKFHGLLTIAANVNNRFRIRGNVTGLDRDITLTAGTYFIRGHTAGGDATQLVEHIQAQVRAAPGAEFDAFTATVSDTGTVTFTNTAEAFTVGNSLDDDWTSTTDGLAQILGFVGALTPAATSFSGANQHRYGWYPDVAPSRIDGDPDLPGDFESDAVQSIAAAGTVVTTTYNEIRAVRRMRFDTVARERIYPTSGVLNRDLERFWRDILRLGTRFRYYPDRTVQTGFSGAAPELYVAEERLAQGGTALATKTIETWSLLYTVPLDLVPFV